ALRTREIEQSDHVDDQECGNAGLGHRSVADLGRYEGRRGVACGEGFFQRLVLVLAFPAVATLALPRAFRWLPGVGLVWQALAVTAHGGSRWGGASVLAWPALSRRDRYPGLRRGPAGAGQEGPCGGLPLA